jgi:hypothetical protein
MKGRRPGDGVSLDTWVTVLLAYVDQCIATGEQPFKLGSYATLSVNNAVCFTSILAMETLLKVLLATAPGAVLNAVKIEKALFSLIGKKPMLLGKTRSASQWAEFVGRQIKVVLAHMRQLKRGHRKVMKRARTLPTQELHKLEELVEMVMDEEGEGDTDGCGTELESQDPHCDSEPPEPKKTRVLRAVATEELDFRVELEQPVAKEQCVDMNKSTTSSSSSLTPSLLIKALMAEPVSAKVKTKAKVLLTPKPLDNSGVTKVKAKIGKTKKVLKTLKLKKQSRVAKNINGGEDNEDKGPGKDQNTEQEVGSKEKTQTNKRIFKVTKAKGRTYLQEKDDLGTWRLIVEVTEKKTMNHVNVVEAIAAAMTKDNNMSKAAALAMRTEICEQG